MQTYSRQAYMRLITLNRIRISLTQVVTLYCIFTDTSALNSLYCNYTP